LKNDILINPAGRAVIKRHRLGACVVTGTDKIRSGFGNGDCLLLDFKNLVFAVSDATERFPAASSSFLARFAGRLSENSAPESKEEWLKLINSVYARQSYNQKTTLSCVAVSKHEGGTTAYIIHGGDSIILLINMETQEIEYSSSPDMNFAGRAKELLSVDRISPEGGEYGFIIASDGLTDLARLSGQTIEKILHTTLSRFPLHEIPDRLARFLRSLPDHAEYDDIGILAFSLSMNKNEDHPTILLGGTTREEEAFYRQNLLNKRIEDKWITNRDLAATDMKSKDFGVRALMVS